jgi:curli biogenesis system outer membrane secretion channel CsgG
VSAVKPNQARYFKINLQTKIAIGRFSNETAYANGIFYDKENDPIGKQTVNILSAKLNSTNKFECVVTQSKNKNTDQAEFIELLSTNCKKEGIDYLIIGSITEFGRKNINEKRKKFQIVQVGISLQIVDVSIGQTIYSAEAKGEAKTNGKKADYDTTLNDKAISDAVSKLVENINKLL